jgi:hypothetical protein
MKPNPYLSLQKGFRILELLAARAPRSVSEIAAELKLEKSHASRLLKSLADPVIHAVSICGYHHQHKEQAIAAAQAGKHLIVEKPLALSLADVREIENMRCDLHEFVKAAGAEGAPCWSHPGGQRHLRKPQQFRFLLAMAQLDAERTKPDRRHYAEGNYEPESARRAAGSGEKLVEAAADLLAELHQ